MVRGVVIGRRSMGTGEHPRGPDHLRCGWIRCMSMWTRLSVGSVLPDSTWITSESFSFYFREAWVRCENRGPTFRLATNEEQVSRIDLLEKASRCQYRRS